MVHAHLNCSHAEFLHIYIAHTPFLLLLLCSGEEPESPHQPIRRQTDEGSLCAGKILKANIMCVCGYRGACEKSGCLRLIQEHCQHKVYLRYKLCVVLRMTIVTMCHHTPTYCIEIKDDQMKMEK